MNRRATMTALVVGTITVTIPTLILYRAVTFLCFVPLVLGSLTIILGVTTFRPASRLNRFVGSIAFLDLAIAVILPFGLIAYHDGQGHPISLILPKEHRGTVKLILDRRRGVDVPLEDGTYIYRIPASGVMTIRDDSPFRRWQSMRVSYGNGRRIAIADEELTTADEVAIHSLGGFGVRTENGRTEESMQWFVGSRAEKLKFVDGH